MLHNLQPHEWAFLGFAIGWLASWLCVLVMPNWMPRNVRRLSGPQLLEDMLEIKTEWRRRYGDSIAAHTGADK